MSQLSEEYAPKPKTPPWRASHAVWLGVALFCVMLFAGRTFHFELSGWEMDRLWEAQESYNQPWKTFVDLPTVCMSKFNQVSLMQTTRFAAWAEYRLIGLDPYMHRLALALWFAACAAIVFAWNRRDGTAPGGALAILALMALPVSRGVFLEPAALNLLCPVFFALASFYTLRKAIERNSLCNSFMFFLMIAAVAYADWKTLFVLPFVYLAEAFSVREGSAFSRVAHFLFGLVLIGVILGVSDAFQPPVSWLPAALTPGDPDYLSQQALLHDFAHAAGLLFGHRLLLGIGVVIVTLALTRARVAGYLAIAVGVVAMTGIYHASRYYEIPVLDAYSLALAAYIQLLWVSPWRRTLAVPLTWMLFSLGKAALLGEGNPLACELALAWVLGAMAGRLVLPGWAAWRSMRFRWRVALRVLFTPALAAALLVALVMGYHRIDDRAAEQERAVHQLDRLTRLQLMDELEPFINHNVYFQRYAHGPTGYAALTWLRKRPQRVRLTDAAPVDAPSLEAVIGQRLTPLSAGDRSLPVYITDAAPAAFVQGDPYFEPGGWTLRANLASAPAIADEKTLEFAIQPSGDPQSAVIQTRMDGKDLIVVSDFVLTLTMKCSNWNEVRSMSLTLRQYDQEYVWNDLLPGDTEPFSAWRSFDLPAVDAGVLRYPGPLSDKVDYALSVVTARDSGEPIVFTIGRMNEYAPK